MDYTVVYNSMQENKWYTASELGVAPATMTALVNRKMVERADTSPRQYRKLKNNLARIIEVLQDNGNPELFTLYPAQGLGMMCSRHKNDILDCYGNKFDISNSVTIQIKRKRIEL